MIPIWAVVLAALFSGLFGAIIAQRMVGSREARDRKNAFRGHLGRWLGAIHQASDSGLGGVHDTFCGEHIMGYCAHLKADVFRKRKFRGLCEALSTTKKDASDYRSEITRKIDELLDFI